MNEHPEKILRRQVLTALGQMPDVLVMCNESNVFTNMLRLLPEMLHPAAYQAILPEERYGLGIGSPDLIVVVRGMFLGLELKSEKGRLKQVQIDWHDAARRKGVRVVTVRSVTEAIEAVDQVRSEVSHG